MRVFLFLLIFMIGIVNGHSQVGIMKVADLDGKYRKQYLKAQSYIKERDLVRAEKELSDLLADVPSLIEARIFLGHIQYERGLKKQAISTYERVLKQSKTFDVRLWFQLAETYREVQDYDEAARAYQTFLSLGDSNEKLIKRAEKSVKQCLFIADAIANPLPFQPELLPESINTAAAEYLPSFTADQALLIYTAVRKGQEDFYESRYENGEWSVGKPIDDLNTSGNEGAQTISADGRVMIFTACDRPDGQGGCDLYIAHHDGEQWSKAQNMGPNINTRFWDSQPSISSNGRLLYFASNRPGGKGKNDIWISYLQDNGKWIKPINAGEPINTSDNDQAPFIHADGLTLYFMSNGHIGMGGYDLFLARLQADGRWRNPQNLGYPINTISNEGALSVQRDGIYAYFSKDIRDKPSGAPMTDIFRFPLPDTIRPIPVTYVRARVLDAVTRNELVAHATLTPVGESLTYFKDSTASDGSFLICLPQGKQYALQVEKSGYLFYSDRFDVQDTGTLEKPITLEVRLQPIPKDNVDQSLSIGGPVVLKNVFFATGSTDLQPSSNSELNTLFQLLVQQPELKIRINGHTDDVGTEMDNLRLSEARAKAVYEYLIALGVTPERISYKGFGESQPVADNRTSQGRQENRRTEFEVLLN